MAFAIGPRVDLAVERRGDAAHRVVGGGFNRNIVTAGVEPRVVLHGLHDLRQHGAHMLRVEPGQVEP